MIMAEVIEANLEDQPIKGAALSRSLAYPATGQGEVEPMTDRQRPRSLKSDREALVDETI
jgi:hypothetical protein